VGCRGFRMPSGVPSSKHPHRFLPAGVLIFRCWFVLLHPGNTLYILPLSPVVFYICNINTRKLGDPEKTRMHAGLLYNHARIGFVGVRIVGSITQISGCQDLFDTESNRAKNILSRGINPSPIFHFLGADPLMVYGSRYGSVLSSGRRAGFIMANLQPSPR